MIVSHRHRFIFVKTRKTAGSSIEAALEPHLGPEDLITGSERDGTPRRNCPPEFTGHVSWSRILQLIGRKAFQSYRRFAVERNSFDKAVSDWLYHQVVLGDTDLPLRSYIGLHGPSDWFRYSASRGPLCEVLRFENIRDELGALCEEMGIAGVDLSEYRLKVNPSRRPAAEYYAGDLEASQAVGRVFSRELEHFGYRLEDG